jgi:hypothetical protein
MHVSDFKDGKIPDNCILTSSGRVIKVPHIIDMGDHIRIQSGAETIYLEKETKEWSISEELIKEDVSWWEKFKRKLNEK